MRRADGFIIIMTSKGMYHLNAMPALQCPPYLRQVYNRAEVVERGSGREGRS